MKVLNIFGTRPEAIKMAPLCKVLDKSKQIESIILVTGQHREMLDKVLTTFGIRADHDLNLMGRVTSLNELISNVIIKVSSVIDQIKPDIVLVHGDTTTSAGAAIAAFNSGVKIGHVEAGLRTWRLTSPWPEEGNRQIIGRLADFHFAPTSIAAENLRKENINYDKIHIVGNTITDAVRLIINMDNPITGKIKDFIKNKKYNVVTCHRRENFEVGIRNVCEAIEIISGQREDEVFIWPVHPNPAIKDEVYKFLANKNNVLLTEPIEYFEFIHLIRNANIIFSDSGGIQEEAVCLKKKVLLLRDNTERPEALKLGLVKLVGTNVNSIISGYENNFFVTNALHKKNLYGDGFVSEKILNILLKNA